MKLIIAGSRTIDKYRAFYETLEITQEIKGEITELVTGCCTTGPDMVPYLIHRMEEIYSEGKGPFTDIVEFPADWDTYGRKAGPLRNREMAQYADALILIWDGQSKGSANMKREMLRLKKPVYEKVITNV